MEIRLGVVIKSKIYLDGVAECFRKSHEKIVLISKESSAELAIRSIDKHKLNLLVIDSSVEGFFSLVKHIKTFSPTVKIVTLAFDSDVNLLYQCMSCGVEGVVTENDSLQELRNCLATVFKGRLSYPSGATEQLIAKNYPEQRNHHLKQKKMTLTLRQESVLDLIVEGYTNKEIARKLNIRLATVKNHVHQILERLNAKNRCEAAAVYRR